MSESLKLENQLCHRFYLLSNAFTRAYRPLLDALDITYPQYVVLMALWENDHITIANLLQKSGIDGGAMTLILKKLTQKAYLTIERDENDKRVKYVTLTKQGQGLKAQASTIPATMFCKFDGLKKDEVNELITMLDKLKGCFSEHGI